MPLKKASPSTGRAASRIGEVRSNPSEFARVQPAARDRETRIAALPWASASSRAGLFRGTMRSFREVWQRRELLMLLIRRELKARL